MHRAWKELKSGFEKFKKPICLRKQYSSLWCSLQYCQYYRDIRLNMHYFSAGLAHQDLSKRYKHGQKNADKDLNSHVNKSSSEEMNTSGQQISHSMKIRNLKPHPDFGKRVWKASDKSINSLDNKINNNTFNIATNMSASSDSDVPSNYLKNNVSISDSEQSLNHSQPEPEYTTNENGHIDIKEEEIPFLKKNEIDFDRSLSGGRNVSTTTSIWEQVDHTEALKEVEPSQTISTMGVLSSNKEKDLMILVNNYTAPVLATGLRDREETLQLCAKLIHEENNISLLKEVLLPYQANMIERRRRNVKDLDLSYGIHRNHLNMLRKYLHRLPRQITRAVPKRASVVIPLCNVNGVSSVLFQKRSSLVRSHTNQVCFPGGMVEESQDANIIDTSLREMGEEIGFPVHHVEILGVLRCDWSEVAKITGVGVTPVVGFLGELTEYELNPNASEVAELFTIPIDTLVKEEYWGFAPPSNTSSPKTTDDTNSLNSINQSAKSALHHENPHETGIYFSGGPHIIWGLTAYILNRFLKDILLKYRVKTSVHNDG